MSRWSTLPDASSSHHWQEASDRDPTTSPRWFAALEQSGSAAADTGWQPLHLQSDSGVVVPLYAKAHSFGEYVFDHGWADASERAGLRYYPKLLTAVPFTPSQGRRLLGAGDDRAASAQEAFAAVQQVAERGGLSSWHVLFPEPDELDAWQSTGMLHRLGCQYHWFDRQYGDFDGFIGTFRQSRRKTVRRERRLVVEQGVSVEVLEGSNIEARHWQVFEQCYRMTYLKRSGHGGYFTPELFPLLAQNLTDRVVMMLAVYQGEYVAAALYLKSDRTLYGRYWGSLEDFDQLHFELCYYQGIDYCLRAGLQRFDAGAQGEHKVLRGFEPVLTHSFHWLAEPRLADAVANFLVQEREHVEHYASALRQDLPFRRDTPS